MGKRRTARLGAKAVELRFGNKVMKEYNCIMNILRTMHVLFVGRRFQIFAVLLCGAVLAFIATYVLRPPQISKSVTLRIGYRPQALADITPVIVKEANLTRPGLKIYLVAVSSPADGFIKFQNGEVDALAGMPLEAVFQQLGSTTTRRAFLAYGLQVDISGE